MRIFLNNSRTRKSVQSTLWGLPLLFLVGCSANNKISNLESIASGGGYQAEYRERETSRGRIITPASEQIDQRRCLTQTPEASTPSALRDEERLSPGDLVDIAIGNDETLSGRYEVAVDGLIKVRGLPSVTAFGRKVSDVNSDILQALITSKYYNLPPPVSVRLVDYGTARAFVSGAVFEPGSVTLAGSGVGNSIDTIREQSMGATTDTRRLSHALQNAGGVRPDADLSRVEIKRGNSRKIIDLRSAITGGRYSNDLILEGDQITVPSRGCFQGDLVTPSAVSPIGVKVFMSNLTEPATSNANAAIGKETREMRYGTRFLQAIVSMNCVGGSKLTNASRSAVLFSRNPITGKSVVIERNIEELLRNGDRDNYDPFILPEDALACYDSRATDIVKVAQGFGIVAGSIILGRGL